MKTPQQRLVDVFTYHSALMDDIVSTAPWKFDVALADDGLTPSVPTPERYTKADRFLRETPTDVQPCDLAALRKFAGRVSPPDIKCPDCHGDGRDATGGGIECEHCKGFTRYECGSCGGEGTGPLPVSYAQVHGVALNRTLLAYALSFVPADSAARLGVIRNVSKNPERTGPALIVFAEHWRIVVMSIKESADTLPTFPTVASLAAEPITK